MFTPVELVIILVAFALEAALALRFGFKAGLAGFGGGFVLILLLWIGAVVAAAVHGGTHSDEFGSVVGDGIIVMFMLGTVWTIVGVVAFIVGTALHLLVRKLMVGRGQS